ncbi:protein FAM124A-like [Mya arenaria]|uniref:protein FAM124A-like n=1 Tax=Mya arenaria TaxID=6604 RepID=UPI0022DFE5E8|nr:protein FAM124A-like [Mya arenaria]
MAAGMGDSEESSGNAYKCRVTLLASQGRGRALEGIMAALTDWVDPYRQIIDVDEKIPDENLYKGRRAEPPRVNGILVTPSLSIMLFMKEDGDMCVSDIQRIIENPPWQFHHKVELQNKSAPDKPVAKQEFYKLSDDLPLFAACPVLTNTEHLRINMYVHRFTKMVEFYRSITETEIETSKPEFCIFELYQQPGLNIQLSLKHSPYLYPVPVESAYISFNVRSVEDIRVATGVADIECVGGNVYTTRDPDGNLVILYENDHVQQALFCDLANAACNHKLAVSPLCLACDNFSFDDGKSLHSTAESHDSGRFSDLEGGKADIGTNQRDKRNKPGTRDKTNRVKSEGYASSDSSSSLTPVERQGNQTIHQPNNLPQNSKSRITSGSRTPQDQTKTNVNPSQQPKSWASSESPVELKQTITSKSRTQQPSSKSTPRGRIMRDSETVANKRDTRFTPAYL